MPKRNLFNINPTHELYQMLVSAFHTLELGIRSFMFRDRTIDIRVNGQGRAYLEVPAYLSAKFRIYQPDTNGKANVMVIIDDLYAFAGERNGKQVFDNPILWGRIQRNANQGESLFFFNDPPAREAMAELKRALMEKGVSPELLEDPEVVDAPKVEAPRANTPKVQIKAPIVRL